MRKKIYFFFFAAMVILRIYYNFSTQLIPGINGGYYPVQVKQIIENGRLGFPDMPLYFYLASVLSKVISFFTEYEMDNAIIIALKVIESFFLPVSLAAVYKIRSEIFESEIPLFMEIAIAAFLSFGFSSVILMAGLQKNAAAMTLMAFFIYYVLKYNKSGQKKHLYMSAIIFLLTGLTHFGTFAVELLILVSAFLYFRRIRGFIPLAVISLCSYLLIYSFDSQRAGRLINVFSEIFTGHGFVNINFSPGIFNLITTVLCTGIVIYARKNTEKRKNQLTHIYFLIPVMILLSIPFVSFEYSRRLILYTYILQSLVIFASGEYMPDSAKKIIAVFLGIYVISSLVFLGIRGKEPVINEKEYTDLKNISSVIENNSETLIIAEHGLEFWVAWILDTKISQFRTSKISDVYNYEEVYVLHRKIINEKSAFPGRRRQWIPGNSQTVYDSDYFTLYRWMKPE